MAFDILHPKHRRGVAVFGRIGPRINYIGPHQRQGPGKAGKDARMVDQRKAGAGGIAGRFGVQDVIWRGTYYTPGGGASGSGYGHYDHVHITTIGGGYPTGGEEYPAG